MRTAVITGASSGLGRELVRQIAREFPEVECFWLIARREQRLRELAGELGARKVYCMALDLCDEKSFDTIAERIYNYPEVQSVYLISGAYDLLVILQGKTLREVSSFVSDKLSTLDTVLSTATHFILKQYKENGTILGRRAKDEREMMN